MTSEVETRIEEEADFEKKYLESMVVNSSRRATDEDSWYIGLIRGRQLGLEWALRELRGESHAEAIDKQIAEGLDGRLWS